MIKMIDIRNLEFRYNRQTKLLNDLNLQIKSGKVNGLLGKNGEGKTTLLKLMSGLLFPYKGKINVLGQIPSKRDPRLLQNIFLLPEELPETTLGIETFEKVYAPFYPDFSSSRFYANLGEFSINPQTKDISLLSYGEKKKVMVAFGLATCAKIILMDEPTNGLDIPAKRQFRRMVSSAINDDCSIVISTHQVLDLNDLIDNIIVINEHEIIFNETIENIIKKLVFKTVTAFEKTDDIIYYEETSNGINEVCENINNEESQLDLEMFFNAVVFNKYRINSILKADKEND